MLKIDSFIHGRKSITRMKIEFKVWPLILFGPLLVFLKSILQRHNEHDVYSENLK